MRIAETSWKNFRNLKPRRLEWRSGLNLLCGANGAGKTNVLEAVNLICGWGGFGGAKAGELLNWHGDGNAVIKAEAAGEEKFSVETSISTRISIKLSNERQSSSELRMRLPALCFLPHDMALIGGSPSIRRAFLDRLCALLSAPYAKRLHDYRRLVRHRIKLLRTGRNPNITSQLMCSIGAWIWSMRRSAIGELNKHVSNELSPVPLSLNIKYGGAAAFCDKDAFVEFLERDSERERRLKAPMIGPHRDDILITCGNENSSVSSVFSRGQTRRATIEIIIASGRVIEKKLRRAPIFLLDEISSELDSVGRELVADALFKTGWQIFAASAENVFKNWNGDVFEVKNGEISCLT